jgi:hypothetical protein
MLRIGSETCSAGLELSTAKRYWKLVAFATGIYIEFIAFIAFIAFIGFIELFDDKYS